MIMRRFLVIYLLLACFVSAGSLKDFEQDLVALYQKTSPSVVSVMTRTVEPGNFFFDAQERQGAGSGVVIDKQGHILTNYHVVEGANNIWVNFNGDKSYPATLVGKAERHDLAVIKVDAPAKLLVPAVLGNSDSLKTGQIAVAIGNPFGMLGRTMTQGIVSAMQRDIEIDGRKLYNMIQTDAPINPGNSGGALINSEGEVVGINTLIFSQSGGSVGVGFAIPINLAIKFIPDLIAKGHVDMPQLGVRTLALSPELANVLRIAVPQGLLVVSVVKGSGAELAGIVGGKKTLIVDNYLIPVGGDVLTAVDGHALKNNDDLSDYLGTHKRTGEQVEVSFWRAGTTHKVKVSLVARK